MFNSNSFPKKSLLSAARSALPGLCKPHQTHIWFLAEPGSLMSVWVGLKEKDSPSEGGGIQDTWDELIPRKRRDVLFHPMFAKQGLKGNRF